MKPKYIYIYGSLVLALIVAFLLFNNFNKTSNVASNNQNMPADDVHKNLSQQQEQGPSKNDLSPEYVKTRDSLKAKFDKRPNDTLAIRKYADFLNASHQGDEAAALYEKILKVNPKRTDIYFALTYVYFNKKDFTKAEEYTNKVLAYDKKNLQAKYNLGAIWATKGEKDKARDIWQKLVYEHAGTQAANNAAAGILKLDHKE